MVTSTPVFGSCKVPTRINAVVELDLDCDFEGDEWRDFDVHRLNCYRVVFWLF